MIQTIVNLFKEQAREHKTVQAFYYNRNYELGTGREHHPLLWLEDPILGDNNNNHFANTVNFSVLFIPKDADEVLRFQNLAFSIGLNMIERIKKHQDQYGVSVQSGWTYLTLRDYYDNNACGCRFSLILTHINIQNLCLIDEQFEAQGTLASSPQLTNFDLSPSASCEVYVNKLPVFDLKTTKR